MSSNTVRAIDDYYSKVLIPTYPFPTIRRRYNSSTYLINKTGIKRIILSTKISTLRNITTIRDRDDGNSMTVHEDFFVHHTTSAAQVIMDGMLVGILIIEAPTN
jgi:hypothetical protein